MTPSEGHRAVGFPPQGWAGPFPAPASSLSPVPNKPKTPTSTFRLDPALMAQVKVKAAARGETVTDVVRRALVNYVRRK